MKFPRLQSESDYLLHLDVVRLSACILILVHHMRFFFSGHLDRTATASWHLIIEVFFAISGFVIAWVYAERVATPASYLRFMWRRIVRLLPLHLAVLALTGVALVGASSIGLQARSGYDLSAGCVVSTAVLTQVYVACSGPHLNYPSWTISVEMLLYAIFPAALLIRRHALMLGVAGAVVWSSFSDRRRADSVKSIRPYEAWFHSCSASASTIAERGWCRFRTLGWCLPSHRSLSSFCFR